MITLEEKIQIVKWYFGGQSIQETMNSFSAAFGDTYVPTKSAISKIIKKFQTCGCLQRCNCCSSDKPNPRNPTIYNSENRQKKKKMKDLSAAVETSENGSSNQISEKSKTSRCSKRIKRSYNRRSDKPTKTISENRLKVKKMEVLCAADETREPYSCKNQIAEEFETGGCLQRIQRCDCCSDTPTETISENRLRVRSMSDLCARVEISEPCYQITEEVHIKDETEDTGIISDQWS